MYAPINAALHRSRTTLMVLVLILIFRIGRLCQHSKRGGSGRQHTDPLRFDEI